MSRAADILDRAIAEGKTIEETPLASTVSPDTPGLGHNRPPSDLLLQADDLLIRLGEVYADRQEGVAKLLSDIGGRTDGVAGVPEPIETDADNGIVAAYMEKLRSTTKDIESLRVREKAPYLNAERAVQQFFAGMTDRLAKTQSILQARGDQFIRRKAAEDRARREREAQEAAQKVREEQEAAARAAREAAELEAAAARARKPENIERLEQAAAAQAVEADIRNVGAMVAQDVAREAAVAAAAPTADIVRTRFETGHLGTGKQVGYVDVTDFAKLDLNLLRPYFRQADIVKALNAWAKTQDYNCSMDGAEIGKRDSAVYR